MAGLGSAYRKARGKNVKMGWGGVGLGWAAGRPHVFASTRFGTFGSFRPGASEVGREWEPPPRGAPWGALSAAADSACKELPDVSFGAGRP